MDYRPGPFWIVQFGSQYVYAVFSKTYCIKNVVQRYPINHTGVLDNVTKCAWINEWFILNVLIWMQYYRIRQISTNSARAQRQLDSILCYMDTIQHNDKPGEKKTPLMFSSSKQTSTSTSAGTNLSSCKKYQMLSNTAICSYILNWISTAWPVSCTFLIIVILASFCTALCTWVIYK